MKNNIKILILLSVFLLSITGVFAFGVSSPYWKNSPLKMYPGESKDVFFNLPNCPSLSDSCSKGDENVAVSLLEGSEIAEIKSGNSYKLPFGSSDTYIKLHVTIPQSASIGSSYNVKFSIISSGSGQGNVVLGTGYYVDFPVIVVEKAAEPVVSNQNVPVESKETNTLTNILLIVGFILIILIIYWIWKKRKG